MKSLRIVYAAVFAVLLITEIWIALFVHDDFVRPYIGDVLVTALLCSLIRIVFPKGITALPLFVFAFALFVEFMQYINIVSLLRLQNNALLSTLIGTTFSWVDLICYAIGSAIFYLAERKIRR